MTSATILGGSSPDLVSRRTLGMAAMPKSAEKMLMHRTLDNLHHFSTGEVVRPPMSTSPDQSNLRPAGKVSAYSAEQLNNIYYLVIKRQVYTEASISVLVRLSRPALNDAISEKFEI